MTPKKPKRVRRTAEEAKSQILDAAEKLFANTGYDGVSLRQITREAGVELALDLGGSDEGAPGPLYLQGDHTAVEYRNIRITPAKAP